jgi:predicted TPR repeat methyltransferase
LGVSPRGTRKERIIQPSAPPSYRESHLNKGSDYHDRFRDNPRRQLLWRLEQELLGRILRRHLGQRPIDHLDFACGTGRILALLEDRTRSSTGVDVSPSMLAIARTHVHRAELIEADLTRSEVLAGRRFDLITAFRFFPNAEPELRREALAALAARLGDDAILVFNNHCHLAGLSYRLARLASRGRVAHSGMWDAEVATLVAGAGLEIRARYHAGVLPETETRLLRPRRLVFAFERAATRLPLAGFASDVLYVCSHKRAGAGSAR